MFKGIQSKNCVEFCLPYLACMYFCKAFPENLLSMEFFLGRVYMSEFIS